MKAFCSFQKRNKLMISCFNLTVVRLMVNLTQPAMLCFGKVPDDPVFRHHFLEVTSHLQAYKEVLWVFLVFLVFAKTAKHIFWYILSTVTSVKLAFFLTWVLVCCFFQTFASEKVFGILSETLYSLLQLVSSLLGEFTIFLLYVVWLIHLWFSSLL